MLAAANVIEQESLGWQPQPVSLPAGAPVGQRTGETNDANAPAGLTGGHSDLLQFVIRDAVHCKTGFFA